MFLSIRLMALIGVGIIAGFMLMPDHVFFLVVGGLALLGGLIAWSSSTGWGIGLVLFGLGLLAVGVKRTLDLKKEEEAEAEKAQDEVRRRMGRF